MSRRPLGVLLFYLLSGACLPFDLAYENYCAMSDCDGGSTAGGSTAGGSAAGGSAAGGSAAGGSAAGGSAAGGSAAGGSAAGGSAAGGSAAGGMPVVCAALASGATEIFVDQAARVQPGVGTSACPFRTIQEALAVPLGSATSRIVRVRGRASGMLDYVEAGALIIPPHVRLTSFYSQFESGGPDRVRIRAGGSCASITGGASGSGCAVGVSHGATIEGFTVTTTSALGTNAIVTAAAADLSLPAAAVENVVATEATRSGIRSFGAVSVGPGVSANRNSENGLRVTCTTSGGPYVVYVYEPASPLRPYPSNFFDENALSGVEISGNCAVGLGGIQASNNLGHGISLSLEPLALTATFPTHLLTNVRATGNANSGLSISGGRIQLASRLGAINRFDGNGVRPTGPGLGYGIRVASPVADFAQLIASPLGTSSQPLVGSSVNRNRHGGVFLAMATGVLGAAHELRSLQVHGNGIDGGTLADGVVVSSSVIGTAQVEPNLRVRWCAFTGNTGVNLRFAQASNNTLDIGTPNSPGQNIFTDAAAVQQTSLCIENMTSSHLTQTVDVNRWTSATTCTPFIPQQTLASSCTAVSARTDFVVVPIADAGISFTSSLGCY